MSTDFQYAHGNAELRPLPRMVPLPTPPLDASPLTDKFLPEGTRPYITTGRKGSLPTPTLPSCLDSRRASAPPPRDLSPVGEFDEDIAPSFWRGDYVAPIGAGRKATSPRKSSSGWNVTNSQLEQRSGIDSDGSGAPALRAPRINTELHQLVNYPSASSLSTSSSKLSARTRSHETTTSAGWSPVDGEPACRPPAACVAVGGERPVVSSLAQIEGLNVHFPRFLNRSFDLVLVRLSSRHAGRRRTGTEDLSTITSALASIALTLFDFACILYGAEFVQIALHARFQLASSSAAGVTRMCPASVDVGSLCCYGVGPTSRSCSIFPPRHFTASIYNPPSRCAQNASLFSPLGSVHRPQTCSERRCQGASRCSRRKRIDKYDTIGRIEVHHVM